MVYLTRQARFSAAHRYFRPELSDEENERLYGPCSRLHGHGHDYRVEVTIAGEVDPITGMVANIGDLKEIVRDRVVEPLDGEFLTLHHPYCRGRVPTCEVLAGCVWEAVEIGLKAAELPAELHRVRLAENHTLFADCARKGGKRMLFLTRSYEFSAAHRLHSPYLTDEENVELFGKCNNPYGHGHNYRLEVTVRGPVDEKTGMIVNLAELDRAVNEEIIRRYDHRHLNQEAEEFSELNPTSENLVQVIWRRLKHRVKGIELHKVTVRETDRNFFTYYGDEA